MIEFAVVGAIVLPLLVEIMQAGFYFYTSAAVDAATDKAARSIMTGQVSSTNITASQFRTQVLCPALAAGMSCGSVVTNVQVVAEDVRPNGFYSLLNTSQTALATPAMDNTKTAFCTGTDGSYIAVQIFYAMPVFSPVWRMLNAADFNGQTVHWLVATRAFRNEPFQSTGTASC